MAVTHNLQEMAGLLGDFVVKQRGVWEHEQWETLCAKVSALGVELDEDLHARLGILLENMRVFYFCMPARPRRKTKAKSKTKARAKKKTAAKSRAKAPMPPPAQPETPGA